KRDTPRTADISTVPKMRTFLLFPDTRFGQVLSAHEASTTILSSRDTDRARGPDVEGEPMPHTRSAKKNLRKSEKRRLRNRAAKKVVKGQIKKFQAALDGPVEELRT